MITPDDVRAAARLLDGVAHRTPLVTSRTLGEHVVAQARVPAARRLVQVPRRVQQDRRRSPRGTPVVAFSSGNHAQAVALAARLLGTPATILMPTDAPASKLAATRGYGAEVVTYDRYTRGPRGDRRRARGRARSRARAAVRRPADHGRRGNGGARAARGRRRRSTRSSCRVGGGGLIAGSATIAKCARRAARGRCRAGGGRRLGAVVRRRRAASRSTCRGRSPTACRRTRPAS